MALSPDCSARVLPGTVLFGARTFLDQPKLAAIARPTHHSATIIPFSNAAVNDPCTQFRKRLLTKR